MHIFFWILIAIVATLIIAKIFKKVLSLAFTAAAITVVVFLVIAGLKYMDENNIRNNFLNSNNIFVLEDNNNLITGFTTHPRTVLDEKDLEKIKQDSSTQNHYKTIIIKKHNSKELSEKLSNANSKEDQLNIFEEYVEENFLSEEFVDNLIAKEKSGEIEVKKESIAFKYY